MPSKKTQNYQLSQWVKSDRVLMDDFNADNEKIDAALKTLNTSLSGKASSSSLSSLQSTVNGKASQSELDSLTKTVNSKASQSDLDALKATVTALQSTVAGKQNSSSAVKTAWGTYTGNGLSGQANARKLDFSATLGRVPELVIIRADKGGGDGLVLVKGMSSTTMNLSGGTGTGTQVNITWDSAAKTVTWYAPSADAQFNTSSTTYRYFAVG